MIQQQNLIHIGQVAVFYVPHSKLNNDSMGQNIGQKIHEFLIDNYDAYTVDVGNTNGYWRRQKGDKIYHDASTRYEVSFSGKEKIPHFVDFLSDLCSIIDEEAIYLTMGKHSYFVTPKGRDEV